MFLDEIWKAGPGDPQHLLTAINERRFRNGNSEEPIRCACWSPPPTNCPKRSNSLEALYDRMLIRLWLDKVQDKQISARCWSTAKGSQNRCGGAEHQRRRVSQWQPQIDKVALPSLLLS